MRTVLSSLLLVLLPCPHLHAQGNQYRVPTFTVHDGDTLTAATVEMDFDVALVRQSIRFAQFDAWEVTRGRKTITYAADEIERGKAARDELATLLKTGEVWITPTGDGKSVYGRLEAAVWLHTPNGKVNVAQWMKQRGHERR